MQTSRRLGMITLNDALVDLVDKGQVEPKEAYLRAIDKGALVTNLKTRGFDMSFIEPEAGSAPNASSRSDAPSPVQARTPAARTGFGLRR